MAYVVEDSNEKKARKAIYTKDDIIRHEELFFDELAHQLNQAGISGNLLHVHKFKDGTLNLQYKNMQFGRVKFSRFGHTIQVITSSAQDDIDIYWFKGVTFEKLLNYIPRLVNYAKHLKTTENVLPSGVGSEQPVANSNSKITSARSNVTNENGTGCLLAILIIAIILFGYAIYKLVG